MRLAYSLRDEVTVLMMSALFLPAAADELPRPTFDGVTYLQWGMDLSEDGDGANAFDVTRAYLGVRQELGDRLAARVLFDAGRGADNGKQWVFLKNAFVEWKEPSPGMKVQAGMIGAPWIGYTEKFLGQRYAAKTFADEYKLQNAADFGVGALGTHAGGLIDWHVVAVNGEGFASPELDGSKVVQGRVSVDPLARSGKMNLPITAFGSYGTGIVSYAGSAGFKTAWIGVTGEYTGRTLGEIQTAGWSAALLPRVPDVCGLYLRYDHLDPDVDADGDALDRVLVGLSRDFYAKVSASVQYDRTMTEAAPDAPSHGAFVKGQVGF